MKTAPILAGIALLGLSGGCQAPTPQGLNEHRLFAMGTWVDVIWFGPATVAGAAPERQIEAELRTFETQFYPWADGELASLNAALAEGRTQTVSDELELLLRMGQEFHQQSDGYFDPGVGRAVEAWGFGGVTSPDDAPSTTHPTPSIADLSVRDGAVSATSRDLLIDLGGYAKGHAVDAALEVFAALRLDNAMVNAGGDLRVLGTHPERPWRIGIVHPRREDALIGVLSLGPGDAAFTSGDYARSAISGDTRTHHLIDPERGASTQHTQAVTVISDSGVHADAAATAIFVAGPDDWLRIAHKMGVNRVLRVDASGRIDVTPGMQAQFEAAGDVQVNVIMPQPR